MASDVHKRFQWIINVQRYHVECILRVSNLPCHRIPSPDPQIKCNIPREHSEFANNKLLFF